MFEKTILSEKKYESVAYTMSNFEKVYSHEVTMSKVVDDNDTEYMVYLEYRINGRLVRNELRYYKRLGNAKKMFNLICEKIEKRV